MVLRRAMPPTAGLAALNFFLADVHSGLGPFLATWLASVSWSPERIGLVMTISGLAALVFNGPAGWLVDRVERPRLWVAVAALAVLAGSLATLPARGFVPVAAAQIAASLGGALMGPALTALTLGVVGKDRFPHQQGRNEAWNHTGNVAAAGLVAVATFAIGAASAFWVLAGMAAGSALALAAIPARAIDSQRASGQAMAQPAARFGQVLADRRLLALGFALLLFHLGNAAMLPLLGQRIAAAGSGDGTRWMAACIIVAQLAMVPVAIVAGRAAYRFDRAWLLLAACLVLPIRGVMAALAHDPVWLVPIQILDACGAGTLGVAVPVLVADLTWGTGRTQSALGIVATLQGIGAALSSTLGGLLATWFGWEAAFLGLTLPAVLALGLAMRLLGQASSANAAVISARV
jgi:MFS family permease